MVGANYTGGRRSAAKARSKDTAGRLQRGHFSKQRLGILTDALRARRADHDSLSHDPNLASDPRPGSLDSLFGHSACTPVATVYDISLRHAKRDLAQKQKQRSQDFHLRQNDGCQLPPSGERSLDQSDRDDPPAITSMESSVSLALTEKGEPGSASGLQNLIPVTTPTAISSCPTPPPQQTPVTEVPPQQRSKILDLLDISDPQSVIVPLPRAPFQNAHLFSDSTSIRAQIDRILSFPSLLGVSRCPSIRPPSPSADIGNDNAVSTRSDGEGCHAVNDLQPARLLVQPPPIPGVKRLPSASPIQIRNQNLVWQRTRHSFRPSDPTHAVINCTNLDRDHPQHHKPTPFPIQSRANSTDGDLPSSPPTKRDRDCDGGNHQIVAPDLLGSSSPEIQARAPPRGLKRDFGCAPSWSSNPGSEGNVMPESMKVGLDEYDTNVGGIIEPNINLGFGSKTVGSSSPPHVQNSISDTNVVGIPSPILGKRTRTEVETPPSKLALVLSSPPPFFTQVDGGDSVNGDGTRPVSRDRVRVPDPSRTTSRYPRISSRSEQKRSCHPSSHDGSPNDAVKSAVGTTGVVNARTPDRRDLGGLRKVSGKVQRVEDRLSPADVQSSTDEDELKRQHKPPRAATVGAGVIDLNNHTPGSFLSDSGIRSCSSTAGSSSPRTEVLSGSRFSQVHDNQDTGYAWRWSSRRDELNEVAAGKMENHVKECRNDLGGAGRMHGYHPSRRLSAVAVDGLDGDEFDCSGMGGVPEWMELSASQDRDDPRPHRSSFRCSTPGSCDDADVESGSQGLPVGSCSTALPHARPRYPGLFSDSGSAFGSHLRRHAKSRTMGDVQSPGSRFHLRLPHQTSISGPFKALTPSTSSTPLEDISYAYDARLLQDNTGINGNMNTSRSIQTHEHVHSDTQEFSTLGFSSSSPSNPLLDGKDKLDEHTNSEAGRSGPGFIRYSLNEKLRSDMKADMARYLGTRAGLIGGADGTLFNCSPRGRHLAPFIKNVANDDGSVSRHVDGTERRDMGGSEREGLGLLDLGGRASPISGFVSRESGDTAAGSLFPSALGVSIHSDEDTRLLATLGDNGEGEESDECGLLKSLLESSDPWGLMRKKVLNLPSPTPSEVLKRRKREEEDTAMVRGSLGRRGVGYVTPPSMDALLGPVDLGGEAEMKVVKECSGDHEDLQVLDFRSSQPHTFFDMSMHCGRSSSSLPPSDFAYPSATVDISSDPLGSPRPNPRFRPYREANHDGYLSQNNLDIGSTPHIEAATVPSGLQSRKRACQSLDSEGAEGPTFIDGDLVQGERDRSVMSPLKFGPGRSVFVPEELEACRVAEPGSLPTMSVDARTVIGRSGIPPPPPGISRIDDMDMEDGTQRHHRKTDGHDRWTIHEIAVAGGGGHDCDVLGFAKTVNDLVTGGQGFYRARESPRTMNTESSSLALGRYSEMESRPVGPPVADDARNRPREYETREDGECGEWGESRRCVCSSNENAGGDFVVSQGRGLGLVSKWVGHGRNERVEGLECETEACDLVSRGDLPEGTRVCPKPSTSSRDDRACGVDDPEPQRIDEDGETGRRDGFALPVPADPYIDFVFSLDDTARGDPQRTTEPPVATQLDYPSVSETLRRLETAIGLPAGAGTTADMVLMNFDATLSKPNPQLSSGGGEAQPWGKLSSSALSRFPFQQSTPKFQTPAPSSLPPTVLSASDRVFTNLGSDPLVGVAAEAGSRTFSRGSGGMQGKVSSGPSLFLDDIVE